MFNFIKKATVPGATTDKEDKEKRKKDKKDRKEKQKRERANMSAEELLRLDEVRRSLKIRGRRKEKEKLPSGITADYTADFLARLEGGTAELPGGSPSRVPAYGGRLHLVMGDGHAQSDSSETSLNSIGNSNVNSQNGRELPPLPPKPPKRGILKTPKVSVTNENELLQRNGFDDVDVVDTTDDLGGGDLMRNTLQNELIAYGDVLPQQNGKGNQLLVITSTSPSADSLTDTTNSSFATPPFSLSPVGESQGFHRWSRSVNFEDASSLPLPEIAPLSLPRPRTLTIRRQRAPRNDFGFSLRRAMVLERCPRAESGVRMRAVIFAEPGVAQAVGAGVAADATDASTGLLPGDKLLEVNGAPVGERSREEIIDMIKASGESVTLKVQPVAELSELSRRSTPCGDDVHLDDSNIRAGTLRRSGSRRFDKATTARTEEDLAKEKLWLDSEKLWLMHRGGFTAVRKEGDQDEVGGKIKVKLEATGDVLEVDEDDLEKANPPQFDRAEDLVSLRHLNESSILHTLRQRYATNLIHTYAGNGTLLIVNPMAPLAIYSEKVVSLFKGCKSEDMPPHIYSTAQSSYHSMLSTRRDQSIVFLGRSGSGKTTNFRHCVQYLVTASGALSKALTLEKLTALWTVLESFGNCKTVMNANATRFTQMFSLDFDQSGSLVSASIQVLMLEKTRITRKVENETTFHVMQRLLCGVEGALRKELFLDNVTGNESNPFMTFLQRHEDRQRAQLEFAKVCSGLNILGVTEAEQKSIFSVLAAIFHLGCAGAAKVGNNSRYQFVNPQCAQKAANLLGTTVEELSRIMFGSASGGMCTPSTPRAPFRTPSPTEKGLDREAVGLEAVEGFIIGLYGEVFNCIVSLINRSISSSNYAVTSILLVDTPGFQNPATCGRQIGASFEDLCHNYLQERLQLLFHHTNLVAPKDRYLQENIDFAFDENENLVSPTPLVSLLDKTAQNSVIRTSQIDLHEGDRRGLLWLLDEEAIYPGSSDESFLERLFTHYGDRDHQLLLRKAPGSNQFIIQHLQGTNPVVYCAKGWLKCSRENPVSRAAVGVLQESCKEEIGKLFVTVRGLGASSFSGSLVGIEGTQSLRRASSIRRTFTSGTAGIKRKSVCLQTKFTVDGLIETLRRTKLRFVQCVLPQHNAGLCETNASLLAVKSAGQSDDTLMNVPLLRSQIRGGQVLDSARLYKQGFPVFMPLGEFRRRFHLLAGDHKIPNPVLDERKAVEDMLLAMDLELSSYRVGLSQIFFRDGVLPRLESRRDARLAGTVVRVQARCRGFLARRRLAQRRLEEVAVRCIQRNVRRFVAVRDWPWWRLLVRVTPLLDVHRTEEELRRKTDELEAIKAKLEKAENERTKLKHDNDKLEAKLSEMTADLAEEHSTATLATERLDAETSERLKLEKELSDVQVKNRDLQHSSERLEMELLYARSDLNGILEEEEDADAAGDGVYKQRYERAVKELEFTKRRLQQQHEDDLEQLVGLKKQLEKKLSDAYEEVEEQRQVVGQWKRKVQKLNGEMNDLRLLLEEQNARNNLLEKKQRKFDSETQLLHDELKKERQARERLSREREVCLAEKYAVESSLADTRLELDLKEERLSSLQREFDEITNGGRTEEEVTVLRKQKIDCERRLQDQEEELDELAGQVQLLEQAKVRLEMSLESMRKEAKKEAQLRDEELEEARFNAQKKVKALEQQLENEHEERTLLLREKHELERRLAAAAESERNERAGDEALLQRLKRDLKRTKALLRDAQAQLERQKAETPGKATIRQLRNQLEDVECARSLAVKAKQSLETELLETQASLEEAHRQRHEAEERANAVAREKSDLQSQLEENEEELAEVLKKFKGTVQQMSLDQMALQEQASLVTELEIERNQLKEQLAELTSRLESVESMGDPSSNLLVKRSELKVKELESKLELEQTTRSRLEVQITRLKEAVEKLQNDIGTSRVKEQQAQDQIRKLQRQLRELKEELNKSLTKESEVIIKKKELEKKCESLEAECATARTDLRLAMKRIEDLQSAIQGDLDDSISDNSESEPDTYSSDDSVNTFLSNHKGGTPNKLDRSTSDIKKFSNTSRSSTSSTLVREPSYT